MSTYQASTGPEPSARPSAEVTAATAKCHHTWANAATSGVATRNTDAISIVRRRLSWSARPPVGNSSMTTRPE
nr:hypothetical protein [Phytohabitans flavus]